ncbi:MAG: protein-export chaperone SecB [Acidiferrobacterales bacterium]
MAVTEPAQDSIFKFEKAYLKDVSYESPNSPRVFGNTDASSEVSIKCNIHHQPIDDKKRFYEVVITVKVAVSQDNMASFLIEVRQGGVFQIWGVPPEDLPRILEVNCPNILMPFAREAVCDVVVKGGFPQLLIDLIDFQALYEDKQKNKAQV